MHDYRKHTPEKVSPVINKVRLKMSLENVVKDIPSMSDSSWTYGDHMVITVTLGLLVEYLSFENFSVLILTLTVGSGIKNIKSHTT